MTSATFADVPIPCEPEPVRSTHPCRYAPSFGTRADCPSSHDASPDRAHRLVFCRRQRTDRCRIADRAFSEHQYPRRRIRIDHPKDLRRQAALLQQPRELQHRGFIRRRLDIPIDAGKAMERLPAAHRVLGPVIRRPEALLDDVHLQHPVAADRSASAAFALRIVRLNHAHRHPMVSTLQCLPEIDLAASNASWPHTRPPKNAAVARAPLQTCQSTHSLGVCAHAALTNE